MDRDIAQKLLKHLKASATALDAAEVIAREISDSAEQMMFRRAMARISLSMSADVAAGVLHQYPDLESEWLGAQHVGRDA